MSDFMELLKKAYDRFRYYEPDIHYDIMGLAFTLDDFIMHGVVDIDVYTIYLDTEFKYYGWDDICGFIDNGNNVRYAVVFKDNGFNCYLVGGDDFYYNDDDDFILKDATILEKVF